MGPNPVVQGTLRDKAAQRPLTLNIEAVEKAPPSRFTLRGREKGDGQCKLYCMVHSIETLGHRGYAN